MKVSEYMKLPYSIIVQERKDNGEHYYFGKILELDGCMSDGKTLDELERNLNKAMKLWLEVSLENGDVIPMPITDNTYSGKFNLRIPKSLHARLAYEAKQEGVSLNQYALYKLMM